MQASDFQAPPSRKRLRRDIRSCYQCRARKVKCQLTTDDVAACAACIKAGVRCTLEKPSTDANYNGLSQGVARPPEERLERIESMLAQLIQSQDSRLGDSAQFNGLAARQFSGDFDPSLFWTEMQGIDLLPTQRLAPEIPNPTFPNRYEPDVAQLLTSLLPCQEDSNAIVTNTTAWLWGLRWCPPGSIIRPNDPVPDLNIAAIANGSTMDLAKALLYLALYMQQLPPDFDTQSLQVPDIETTVDHYVSTVNSLVLSDEEVVCSGDGLECLHMLGMIYMNKAAFRKAWLSFRRALDVAKMKGFRDSYTNSAQQGPSSALVAQRRLWLDTIAGDCYLSLLLGLEPVLGSEPFGREDDLHGPPKDVDATFEPRLYPIVARLAQKRFLGQHDSEYARAIDQDLDNLWASMPSAWQRTPTLRPGRSFESAKDYSRLMCHLYFFLIRIFVHLPFAFSATETGGDQEYSRDRCLEASRIILQWCLGLQREGKGQPRCKVIDITAFLAAVTLLLTKADDQFPDPAARPGRHVYSADTALVEQFIHSQEVLGQSCDREHIAEQSAHVLSAMLVASNKLEVSATPDSDKSEHAFVGAHSSGIAHERSGLEDMLTSSFRKALGTHSPAARLFDLAFPTNS